MAVFPIVQLKKEQYDFCDSCLRMPAKPLEQRDFGSKWLKDFVADMFETLYLYPSGVGLAANQVGILVQVCVVDIKRDGQKPIVLINPTYSSLNGETTISQEVCLSFPFVSAPVPRFKKIKVEYYDIWGNKCELIAEGFKSSVLQHEIDHLSGCVHVDLIKKKEDLSDYPGSNVRIATKAMSQVLNKEEKEK